MTAVEGADIPTGEGLQSEMDELSLEQALVDFEIANARVLDLTQRLIESARTISELQAELHALKIQDAQTRAEFEKMKSSKAYRTANKVWQLRNAIGV